MKTVSLADVLWTAANVYLQSEEFSCHAVYEALNPGAEWDCRPDHFLVSLGCDVNKEQFLEFAHDERQGVRYIWLLLAMHVAEDEGIMVEVAS